MDRSGFGRGWPPLLPEGDGGQWARIIAIGVLACLAPLPWPTTGLQAQSTTAVWVAGGLEGEPVLERLEKGLRGIVREQNSGSWLEPPELRLGSDGRVHPDTLRRVLERVPTDERALVFVYCPLRACDHLMSDPVVAAFGLTPLNPRVLALPLYVFGRASDMAELQHGGATPVRVGYYAAPGQTFSAGDIEAVIETMASDDSVTVTVRRENNANELVRGFTRVSDPYQFVAIYDEEPSLVLSYFLQGLSADTAVASELELWSTSGRPTDTMTRITGSATAAYLPVGVQRFYRSGPFAKVADSALVAVVGRHQSMVGAASLPVLLSNAHTLEPGVADILGLALSDVYLDALAPLRDSLNLATAANVGSIQAGTTEATAFSRTLLTNAYLADNENPYKALLLYSHYRAPGAADPLTYKAMADWMDRYVRANVNTPESGSWDSIEALLRSLGEAFGVPTTDTRAQFSRCGRLEYQAAKSLVNDAGFRAGSAQEEQLYTAARRLFNALEEWSEPGRPRCSGMWHAENYDPYYLLALVDVVQRRARP